LSPGLSVPSRRDPASDTAFAVRCVLAEISGYPYLAANWAGVVGRPLRAHATTDISIVNRTSTVGLKVILH